MKYAHLTSSSELPDISALRPFKALVVVEEAVASERRAAISQWLVDSGCLYMMAWGEECESWSDAVELANREAFTVDEIPDVHVVIATSHADEQLGEAFWFSKFTALHPCFRLDNTVILHLSPKERERELIDGYAAA